MDIASTGSVELAAFSVGSNDGFRFLTNLSNPSTATLNPRRTESSRARFIERLIPVFQSDLSEMNRRRFVTG